MAADLGFARQRGYPWHPAMRTGVFARGTRIRVTFFGTGETGSVDKNKWTSYSDKVAERIITPRMLKNTGFKMGLDQLKNNLKKISTSSTGQEVITNPSVSFANQPEGSKLVKLNKDRLQKEEEENIRLMHEKIEERDGSPHKYGCKACSWKGKFLHKAKAHIRDCGSRRKERKRNPKNKKYSCSGKDCNMVFPCLSKLQDHYRLVFECFNCGFVRSLGRRVKDIGLSQGTIKFRQNLMFRTHKLSYFKILFCRVCHFQPEQGYNCVPCQTVFSSWKNFKRHMESKHGETASLHCNSCAYKTHRMDNMVRHMESQHSNLKMISSLVNDLISQLGACDVAEGDFVEENPNDEEPVEEEGPSEGDSSDDQEEELSPHLRERNEHVANVQAEFRRLFPTFESEVLELKSQGRKRGGGGRRKKSPRSLPLRRSSRAGSNIFAEISELQEELDAGRSDDESASEVVTGGGCELSASGAVGVQVTGGQGHGEGGQGSGERVQGDGGLQGESEGDLQGASGGNHQGPEKGAHWSGVGGNQGEGSGDQGDVDGGLHVQVEEGNLTAVAMGGVLGAAQEQDLHALGKFGCQSCDMSFRDTGNLRRHVKLVHTSRMIPVKCPRSWCDAEFLILAHMLSHKEDCLRVCPYPGCVKKFSKQNRFDGHQRAHLTMTRRMID